MCIFCLLSLSHGHCSTGGLNQIQIDVAVVSVVYLAAE